MAGIDAITQKIIDILKADSELKDLNFFFGVPWRRRYPFIYVKWVGGPISGKDTRNDWFTHDWFIVCGDRHVAEDVAEKSVMDKIKRVRDVLKANRTLDGLVSDSRVISMEGAAMLEERFSVSLAGLTLRVEWEESAT